MVLRKASAPLIIILLISAGHLESQEVCKTYVNPAYCCNIATWVSGIRSEDCNVVAFPRGLGAS